MASERIRRVVRYAAYIAVAAVFFYVLRGRSSGPDVGIAAADFELPVVAGDSQRFHLAQERGTPVLIEVFASWCGACRSAAPTLAEAARAPRARPVRFIGVNVDESPQVARQLKTAWDIPYDVAHDDGRFSQRYGIQMLPTLILIDAEGTVRQVSTGAPRASTLEGWLDGVGASRVAN
jgi:cytochrome c biogenesis protein CcmG, thiol:disulfide interchange protein DsbE